MKAMISLGETGKAMQRLEHPLQVFEPLALKP